MTQPLTTYLKQMAQALATGDATELTHRSTLEMLLEDLSDNIQAINEPKRSACGAPDLAVLRDGLLVGHIEAKDVGVSLEATERSEQLRRYRAALDNLILTDYLEFRWYVGGELRRTARLAQQDLHGALDGLFQFAHVARPRVIHQHFHGLVADRLQGLVVFLAVGDRKSVV